MISIVLSGRNDDYGGDFKNRCLSSLLFNLKYLDQFNIDYEMIYVEWNPVPEKSLLSINFPNQVKKFVVDPLLHRYLSGNKFIQFYEFFAKNVGAARSKGDYILFTNAEVLFDEDVLKRLKAPLDSSILYRSPRNELKREAQSRLEREGLSVLRNLTLCTGQHEMFGPPHTNASGDFALCSRMLVETCGGYDESIRFGSMHQDGRFVHRIFGMTGKCEIIGKIFHIDHDRPQAQNPKESPGGPAWNYNKSNNYCNGNSWGFRDITHDEVRAGITYVWLNADLIEQAKSREIPYPSVPEVFR